jgi:hypothetical protein
MKIRIIKPDIIPYPYDFDGVPEGHRHAYAVENTMEIDLSEFSVWYQDKWFAKEGGSVYYDNIQFLLEEFIKDNL